MKHFKFVITSKL